MTGTRIALGSLVIALALAGAVWLHGAKLLTPTYHESTPCIDLFDVGPDGTGIDESFHPSDQIKQCGAQHFIDSIGRLSVYWKLRQPGAQDRTWISANVSYLDRRRYSWQDPLAVFLAIAGLGGGAAILTGLGIERRRVPVNDERNPAANEGVDSDEIVAVKHLKSSRLSTPIPTVTEPPTRPTEAKRPTLRALQTLGYLAFGIVGATLAAPAMHGLIAGLFAALLWLLILGSIGFLFVRSRGRDRTWRQVALGRTAVLITLVFLFLVSIEPALKSHN